MLTITSIEHFFKPEVRKQGERYYDEDAVYLSNATDTSIAAVIKSSPPIRIAFSTESISDPVFKAACSCAASAKGQLCKHIWATILTVKLDYPDFFDAKTDLEKAESRQAAQKDSRLKAKQSEYRKEQYQKLKSEKKTKKARAGMSRPSYSDEVQAALQYFSKNGFELENPIQIETLRKAKTILSRVFHPDKGGSHQEILELNNNFDIVLNYLE